MLRDVLRGVERVVRTTAKRSEFSWRYLANLIPTLAYGLKPTAPTGEAARVLAQLNRDGVAITSIDALLAPHEADELLSAAAKTRRDQADRVAASRAELAAPPTGSQKPFVVPLLGFDPPLDHQSPFARFALQPAVLQVVNGYYGMYVRLRHYNIWHNLRTTAPATQSQLWHRDPEDLYILKLFVALEDIDDGSGPLVYAGGSHRKGDAHNVPEYTHKDGVTPRSNDQQMSAVVPPARWVKCVGRRGTMIFADTRGFHKGGLAREHDRVLYIAEYTSAAGGRGGLPTR